MRWLIVVVIAIVIILYLMNRGEQEASKPAPPPPPPAVAPAPPPPPPQLPIERFQQAAAATGVTLINVTAQPGGALVAISWKGDVATLGGDFLERCLRDGIIRDFDVNPAQPPAMGLDPNGTRVTRVAYSVRF